MVRKQQKSEGVCTRVADRDGFEFEESRAFAVTKPVDPNKIEATLAIQFGVVVGVLTEGAMSDASPENPVLLWIVNIAPSEEDIIAAVEAAVIEEEN